MRPLHVVGALLDARAVHPGRTAANHLLALAQTAGIGRKRVDEVLGLVGRALSQVDATMNRVRLLCLLVGAGLLAVVGWFWVRAGLRPLRRIEETAAAIAGGDLSRRVPPTTADTTEVGRLTASPNGMLAQIEAAVAARARSEERLRRFVADASHEPRTPLAGISGFAQLYRMGGAEIDATMDRIERESLRLTGLVDDLLLLAQLDERGLSLRGAPTPRLPPEAAAKVFDRFYRADTSRTRDHGGGAGLGLAIVWSLVTAHGGEVALETEPGHGTTFRVSLPTES